jgi:hypothetical protein
LTQIKVRSRIASYSAAMDKEVELLLSRAMQCIDVAAKAGDRKEFERAVLLARAFNDMAEELEHRREPPADAVVKPAGSGLRRTLGGR